MKTVKNVLNFVFEAIDLPTELQETQEQYIQAHKCLNIYLQSGIVSDNSIKEAQSKIDKILYFEKNKKDYENHVRDFDIEIKELIDIVNGCISC